MTSVRQLFMLLAATASFAVAVTGTACGSGFFHGVGSGARDAGSAAPALCYDTIPDRPSLQESPTDVRQTFAVEDLRIDTIARDAGLAPPEGHDLDRTCTCSSDAGGSCTGPASKTCDGPRGQDNALGEIFNQLPSLFPSLELGDLIRRGAFTALIDVEQWNGEDEDPEVTVAMRMSQGLESHIDGGEVRAQFDGTDVWTVDPGTILSGTSEIGVDCAAPGPTPCVPLHHDIKAYVTGGMLYAHVDVPFAVSTASGRLVLDMRGGALIGKLSKAGAAYRLDAELVGRIPASSFLPSLAAIRHPETGKSLCDDISYGILKSSLCASLDIASDPDKDGQGAPCDALSASIRFTAGPARIGHVFQSDQASSDCSAFTDHCPN
jgi:hypothetical protein